MIPTFWKKEFRLELFGVEYSRPAKFVRCQWQKQDEVHIAYLIYRWLLAGYFLGSLVASICEPGKNDAQSAQYMQKWPIYLTNWGYTMYALQAVIGVFIVTEKFVRERKPGYEMHIETTMPCIYQIYWILHSVAVVLAFGITVSYWVSVYNPAIHTLSAINIIAHALNAVFMGIDLYLVSHPFRLLHCYWPILFVAVYLIFSVIYFAFGGLDRNLKPYIYPVLNWQNGLKTTAAAVVGLLFVLFVHTFTWTLFLTRRWIYTTYAKKNKSVEGLHGFSNSVASESSIHLDVI